MIIGRLDQAYQQFPSAENQTMLHDPVTEGKPEKLNPLEKSIQAFYHQGNQNLHDVKNKRQQKTLDVKNDQLNTKLQEIRKILQTKINQDYDEHTVVFKTERQKQEKILGSYQNIELQQRVLKEQVDQRNKELLNIYGKRVLTDPSYENVEIFTTKWNESVLSGREVTKSMKIIFNEIVTHYERDIIYRVIKKEKPILIRNFLKYIDLVDQLNYHIRTTQGPRTIFGTWKELRHRNIMWKIKLGSQKYYVRKTHALTTKVPKDYWNKGHRGYIFSKLLFDKTNIGIRGDSRKARALRKSIKDQIPELRGKNFQGSVYRLKYEEQAINELMTLIWMRKINEKPTIFDDEGFFQKFSATRQPFPLESADSQFRIFLGNEKEIENTFKSKIIEIAKKVNAWDDIKKKVDYQIFIKEVNSSDFVRQLKKIILNKVLDKGVLFSVEQARELGFGIETKRLWSSEYELHKVAAGVLKDQDIRKVLKYPCPSNNINILHGSLSSLLSNPDVISNFKNDEKTIVGEVLEVKVIESGSSRVHPVEFLFNYLLCKGYVSKEKKTNIGKALFFIKHDEPLIDGTKVGKTLNGQSSGLIFIDFNKINHLRFAEIFNEVRLEYFSKKRQRKSYLKKKIVKNLKEQSTVYGLDLKIPEETVTISSILKLSEMAASAKKSQYKFVLEVFLQMILESN